MIRRIGIDFGTSTTVLRVKNYADDGRTPIGSNVLSCDSVKFGGMDTIESVVREWTEGGAQQLVCGAKAISDRPGSTLWSGFKMDLESPDAARAQKAWELTDAFFRYLYSVYSEDNANGSFGDAAEREETWVSHPVKWREETARRLAESAEKAGFRNVRRMNEAQAAVTSVALRNVKQLREKLNLAPGDSCRVLLVDMGAGTTDLVLGDYSYADDAGQIEFHVDVCWPLADGEAAQGSGLTCGGREFDGRLTEYFQELLQRSGLQAAALLRGSAQVKSWKERDLSPSLAENVAVDSFAPFDMYQQMTGNAIPFRLDREAALQVFRRQLSDLIELVNGCMAQTDAPYVDAIVPVGGGSQWFFVRDLLSGRLDVDGKFVFLARRDKTRPAILPVYRPQETVAQGLVLAPLSAAASDADGGENADSPENSEARDVPAPQSAGEKAREPVEPAAPEPAEPAGEIGELWKRKELVDCLTRRLLMLFGTATDFAIWTGLDFAWKRRKLRKCATQILKLLCERDGVRVAIEYKNGDHYILTGIITRADCNQWLSEDGCAPLFPKSFADIEHAPIAVHKIAEYGVDGAIDDIRGLGEEWQLTQAQRDALRAAMRELEEKTRPFRKKDRVLAEGEDCIPMDSSDYRKINRRACIRRHDFEVYYCHLNKGSLDYATLVTDMGVIECLTKGVPELYAWHLLAEVYGIGKLCSLTELECGSQLRETLEAFLAQLKRDHPVDFSAVL